jgi:tRNA(fMet)-specific endonuclease VapC
MEFAEGYERHEHAAFLKFIEPFHVLPLSAETAWKTGQIRRRLRSAGRPVGDNDLLIAATALHHGIPLVTRNQSDFEDIEGLDVVGY